MIISRSIVLCLVLSIVAGGLSGVATVQYVQRQSGRVALPILSGSNGIDATSTILTALQQQEAATIEVVRDASPAVVSIVITKTLSTVRSPDRFFSDLFDDRFIIVPSSTGNGTASSTQRLRVGGGSGFFVAADGYIVTNKHVVDDKAAEYTVVLQDGRELSGKVLALDPSLDLAVIKVEGTDFPVLPLGDSDQVETGQTVIAIGNALAEFQNTVTKGIVSGINRHLIAGAGMGGSEVIEGAIQTDAAINPGNSGGPLINLKGQVVGVNTAISESAQSLGFALPINVVKQAVESVKRNGRIIRPWLGVRYIQIDREYAEEKGLKQNHGVLIQAGTVKTEPAIIPDSPAQKAGLLENDIILEVNGRKLDEDHSLSGSIAQFAPGDTVSLKVMRQEEERMIQVTLAERKDQ